jgi:hypothetical protein
VRSFSGFSDLPEGTVKDPIAYGIVTAAHVDRSIRDNDRNPFIDKYMECVMQDFDMWRNW